MLRYNWNAELTTISSDSPRVKRVVLQIPDLISPGKQLYEAKKIEIGEITNHYQYQKNGKQLWASLDRKTGIKQLQIKGTIFYIQRELFYEDIQLKKAKFVLNMKMKNLFCNIKVQWFIHPQEGPSDFVGRDIESFKIQQDYMLWQDLTRKANLRISYTQYGRKKSIQSINPALAIEFVDANE